MDAYGHILSHSTTYTHQEIPQIAEGVESSLVVKNSIHLLVRGHRSGSGDRSVTKAGFGTPPEQQLNLSENYIVPALPFFSFSLTGVIAVLESMSHGWWGVVWGGEGRNLLCSGPFNSYF